MFRCFQLHHQNAKDCPPRSISLGQFAAQNSRPLYPPPPRLSLLFLPSTPDPTGINIVRTEFTVFLSQLDPLLAIPKCSSSFSLLTSSEGWPTAPELQTSSLVSWYSSFILCSSWCHASFGRMVTLTGKIRLTAPAQAGLGWTGPAVTPAIAPSSSVASSTCFMLHEQMLR